MEEVTAYKCGTCRHTYDNETDALECEFKHARYNFANALLNKGNNLSSIKYWCGFNWNLSEKQKEINKDNCFIISHWQCCEKPAYRIRRIEENGNLYISGIGSWNGAYGNEVNVSKLPEPHLKEELFSYK
jgi:hypothetical protein